MPEIWDGSPLGFDREGRAITYNAADDGSGNAPTLIFGPPGTSKTVGLVCAELLDEPGRRSYVVLDPEGRDLRDHERLPPPRLRRENHQSLRTADRSAARYGER